MRTNRIEKNKISMHQRLLRLLYDAGSLPAEVIKGVIIAEYSDQPNTIYAHLKLLRDSGFVKSGIINGRKVLYFGRDGK